MIGLAIAVVAVLLIIGVGYLWNDKPSKPPQQKDKWWDKGL